MSKKQKIDYDALENDSNISPTLKALVEVMERRFHLPGTNYRFGLDALIGLVPGIGDFLGMAIGSLLILEGMRHKVPVRVLLQMAGNLWLDAALGSVPVVGDAFDFFFKANRRNLRLLEKYV